MTEDILDLPALQWYPGHMKRAKDIILENLKLVDVVVELLDARAPLSSKNPMLDEILENKTRIIAMNKADLADKNILKKYTAYFREKGIKAVYISSTGGAPKNLLRAVETAAEEKTQKWVKNGAKPRAARVMILGIPNVGKSTLINSIAGKNKAKAADTPGVTRNKQWVKIGKNLELLDTPGILWPKFDDPKIGLNLAFLGAINDEVYDNEKVAVLLIEKIKNIANENLIARYKLQTTEKSGEEILEDIGKKRGCLVKGGAVDTLKAAKIVLTEFRSGKLGEYVLPEDGI
ncbi:MAG: ribosome biogenesis GTPase YlqF [Selenomonadaceae bacterium]|nr:ribosome biogenesis GTPase YlqF [Selenomonadaceae bacterium]MBP3723475.1 ribosome biogenesis GTPase YlqF [Selenomonadaceae bacterium]